VSIAPASIVLLSGVIALYIVAMHCPGNEALHSECKNEPQKGHEVQQQHSCMTAACEAQALLGFVLVLAAPLTRTIIRVTWEVGAMLLLLQGGKTAKEASMMISFVALVTALLQVGFPQILRFYKALYGKYPAETQVLLCMELVGCVGFLIMLLPSTVAFLAGSLCVYCSTVLTAAPITSFGMRLTASGTKWISQSSALLASQTLWGLSCFLAPIYSRLAMSYKEVGGADMHGMFMMSMAPLLCCQLFVNMAGVHGVQAIGPSRDGSLARITNPAVSRKL
jgi:hypothetical protein